MVGTVPVPVPVPYPYLFAVDISKTFSKASRFEISHDIVEIMI